MNLSEETALPMIDEDAVDHIPKNPPSRTQKRLKDNKTF